MEQSQTQVSLVDTPHHDMMQGSRNIQAGLAGHDKFYR